MCTSNEHITKQQKNFVTFFAQFFSVFFFLSLCIFLSSRGRPSFFLPHTLTPFSSVYFTSFWTINSLIPSKRVLPLAPRENKEDERQQRPNEKWNRRFLETSCINVKRSDNAHTYKLYRMWEINSKSLLHSTHVKKISCGLQLQRSIINLTIQRTVYVKHELKYEYTRESEREKEKTSKCEMAKKIYIIKGASIQKNWNQKLFKYFWFSFCSLTHLTNRLQLHWIRMVSFAFEILVRLLFTLSCSLANNNKHTSKQKSQKFQMQTHWKYG